jgi:hypothetical protein
MFAKLKERLRRLRERGDVAVEDRPNSNVDALSATRPSAPDASGDHLPGTVPPGYIKDVRRRPAEALAARRSECGAVNPSQTPRSRRACRVVQLD